MSHYGVNEQFISKLREGARILGLELSDDGLQRLATHQRLLLKWADKMNLTSLRDPEEIAESLYLDSAILLPHLEASSSLHDVGTGAGFPGLVLKALQPGLRVTLTEARRKKVSFLRQAAREMELDYGLEICMRRLGWEEQPWNQVWSEVVSRATFPPKEWVKQGAAMVAPGGRLWIFLGRSQVDPEAKGAGMKAWWRESLPMGLSFVNALSYRLPFSRREHILVSLRRIGLRKTEDRG